MKIGCAHDRAVIQVLDVLQRHDVTRTVSWEGGSPLDARMWIVVSAILDPTTEPAIRRDIDCIFGAAVQE